MATTREPDGEPAAAAAVPSASAHRPHQPHGRGVDQRKQKTCFWFASKNGCRKGAACPFSHDLPAKQRTPAPAPAAGRSESHSAQDASSSAGAGSSNVAQISPAGEQRTAGPTTGSNRSSGGSTTAPPPAPPPITPRPVPQSQLQDPRTYQLSQVRRRYGSVQEHEERNGSTVLDFRLKPSDPDFPFEIDALQCSLRVPPDFPRGKGRPSLRVLNAEMERGYQINVESGWERIVAESQGGTGTGTLLGWLNKLDRELEGLLSMEKAEEVKLKLVRHERREEPLNPASPQPLPHRPPPPVAADAPKPALPPTPAPVPDAAALSQARQTRDAEIQQLQARMGRLPQFSKSPDGLSFTLPIQVHRKQALPLELQAIKQVTLIVPERYNIEPCRVQLVGVSGPAAEAVQKAFEERARATRELSLFNHVNYLAQNMHVMAKEKEKASVQEKRELAEPAAAAAPFPVGAKQSAPAEPSSAAPGTVLEDRPHVVVIPRPPEWDAGKQGGEDHDEDSSSSESEEESDLEEGGDHKEPQQSTAAAQTPERGVLVSFPHLELHGIELLEIVTMNITVKCERCKDTRDITGLHASREGAAPRKDSCGKCSAPFTVAYRPEYMHANSIRAGYLDLEGCIIVDMLPSSFVPTCSECSTAYPRPGVVSVRGETSMAFCRECHRKMTFRLPEIKFLRTSTSAAVRTGLVRKKKTENLGIVAGRELPNRGRCAHYKKSYRWFRFSCCNKVFPCDRCHDEVADHVIEHANRMICGFCSREQNFRPKDCGICHAWLTVRPGKGFWEGGQGTRDRVKMSRKDPRKYKRVGGSKVGSS